MLIFADWRLYQTGYLALASTLVYCKSRGSSPHVGFRWSRWQGLYAATMAVCVAIAWEGLGANGVGGVVCLELLLLLLGVHEARPDLWAAVWSALVLVALAPFRTHLLLGGVWTVYDIMDLRFMGRMNCGVHISLIALYAWRPLPAEVLWGLWAFAGVCFFGSDCYPDYCFYFLLLLFIRKLNECLNLFRCINIIITIGIVIY